MKDLSIIIVNWNGQQLLRDCLSDLKKSCSMEMVQTIVVDNASIDGSVKMVETEFPWVQLVRSDRNLGFAAGNNLGLQVATGRWIMLLNNDTLLPEHFISDLTAHLATLAEPSVLGPKLLNPNGSLQPSVGTFPTLWRLFMNISMLDRLPTLKKTEAYIIVSNEFYQSEREVDWVSGACMIAHHSIFEKVGGLDTNYFMYVEEVDWCYRVRNAGYPIKYWPGTALIHINSGSAKSRIGKVTNTYRSLTRFYDKFHSRAARQMLRPTLIAATLIKLLASLAAFLANRRRQDASDCLRAYGSALSVLLERNQSCAS